MKKRWIVLCATVLGLTSLAGAVNYHGTHSGPFSYYRLKHPNLSTAEIATLGSEEINDFFTTRQNNLSAEIFLAKLQINCQTMASGDLKFGSSGLTGGKIVQGFRCRHEYSFIPGIRIWTVSYLIRADGSVTRGKSRVICPICQGV